MTALSVLPGQTAQEVSPNPKCNNCLHYMSNGGRSGVCTIGLRPWLCGDGDNQIAGYAPLDGQAPSDPGSFADQGRANAAVDQLQTVPMSLTVLGDEHAEMAKSLHDELDRPQKMTCPLHQNAGVAKSYNASVGAVVCHCKRIASKSVAQKLWKALENKERVHLTIDDVVFFVRGVRKGMTPFEIAISKLHAGTDNSGLNKSLYAPDKLRLGDNNVLAKSLYGEDWTSQFTGTPLFDEAAKLREREIAQCEAELKRRIERAAQRKKEAAQMVKESPYDYEADYAREEKIRIDKSKLMLKLQQYRNKQLSPKSAVVKALKPGVSVSQQAVDSTHATSSVGGVSPQQKAKLHAAAANMHRMAAKTHKQLGNTAVASAHRALARSHATLAAGKVRGPNLGSAAESKAHSEAYRTHMPTIKNALKG